MMWVASLLLCCLLHSIAGVTSEVQYDKNGYVMYCPCMGRFGNQADHFLGSLSFARKLNRTLVVPPWITHEHSGKYRNNFIPYERWFEIDALKQYHRVVSLEEFMEVLAPSIWPPGKRRIYCHKMAMERSKDKHSCPAKDGNPFRPFWDNFRIDFASSEAFPSPLSYYSSKSGWDKTFPVKENLVLTFMGAPAAYPVKETDKKLQEYVEFNDRINEVTLSFLQRYLAEPFVGIHLRNGMDWRRACEHVKDEGTELAFMSSPQCVGRTKKKFTKQMCFPETETVIQQTLDLIKQTNVKHLFIATDDDDFRSEFESAFSAVALSVSIIRLQEDSLIKDLAILIEAQNFIGSCGSSVTAFVVRKREVLGRPNQFFGVEHNDRKSEL